MAEIKRFIALKNSYGQGFAEFALLLGFVGMGLLLTFVILEPAVLNVPAYVIEKEDMSPPTLANYDTSPFKRPFPTPTPNLLSQ